MANNAELMRLITERYAPSIIEMKHDKHEVTVNVAAENLLDLAKALRDDADLRFDSLMDVTAVDYLHYGLDEWQTQSTTATGFSRGTTYNFLREEPGKTHRFSVVYHLLSYPHNHRLRLKVALTNEAELMIDSVNDIWPAANWFEREVFDLFGIFFRGHPDLRRILTDYGFVGHPFRKDFPLIGRVEARYDAKQKQVIYEPVSIEPRILEPKVIRHDNRYAVPEEPTHGK